MCPVHEEGLQVMFFPFGERRLGAFESLSNDVL